MSEHKINEERDTDEWSQNWIDWHETQFNQEKRMERALEPLRVYECGAIGVPPTINCCTLINGSVCQSELLTRVTHEKRTE